jgi:hypothetical protein
MRRSRLGAQPPRRTPPPARSLPLQWARHSERPLDWPPAAEAGLELAQRLGRSPARRSALARRMSPIAPHSAVTTSPTSSACTRAETCCRDNRPLRITERRRPRPLCRPHHHHHLRHRHLRRRGNDRAEGRYEPDRRSVSPRQMVLVRAILGTPSERAALRVASIRLERIDLRLTRHGGRRASIETGRRANPGHTRSANPRIRCKARN